MQTSEERFLASLRSLGMPPTPEVIKEAATEATEESVVEEKEEAVAPVVEEDAVVKVANMPLSQLMEDPNFLRGISDRIAQRGYEIEAAVGRYLMTE